MKAIVSLSGGMDSATTLAQALDEKREVVECVGFFYGSKHNNRELGCAAQLSQHYNIPYREFNLLSVMKGFKSALLDKDQQVPEGHYEAESMRQTVVPGRNIIFLSILAGEAWSVGANEVWIGIHAGDHFIYPDCRPEFFKHMQMAILTGTEGKVGLQAPFLNANKTGILSRGLALKVPYEMTRTCYTQEVVACGKCGSCQERLESFKANGIEDPLEYQSRELFPKEAVK